MGWRNSLKKSLSPKITVEFSGPLALPVNKAEPGPKLPSVRKLLIWTVLLTVPSPSIKSKAKFALVPAKLEVSTLTLNT